MRFRSLMYVILVLLIGCHGHHSSHKEDPVTFDGYEFSPDQKTVTEALADQDVTTTEQVFETFATVESFNRILETFGEDGPDSGKVITFIRELEIKDQLQPSVEGGALSQKNLDKIVALDLPFETLARFFSPLVQPAAGRISKGSKATPEDYEKADELIAKEQLIRLNNLLAEQGLGRMKEDDFAGFRRSLAGKSARAGRILTESNQKSAEGRASDDPEDLPAVQENQAELNETPGEWLDWVPNQYTVCEAKIMTFPLPVAGPGVETSYPFVQDGASSVRQLLINQKGLAVFRVDSETADGNVFIFGSGQGIGGMYLNESPSIPMGETRYFHLPVFDEDLCRPFNIIVNGGAVVTLMDVIDPRDVEPAGIEGGLVETIEVPGGLSLTQYAGPNVIPRGYFSLSLLSSDEGYPVQADFGLLSDHDSLPSMNLFMLAPSGKTYTTPLTDETVLDITMENGRWEILVLPENSLSFEGDTRQLKSVELEEPAEDQPSLSLSLSMEVQSSQTRKFVVGTLDKAAFARDGEPTSERAEVEITLHTNMAPRYELEEDLDEILGRNGGYFTWKCWVDNGKDADTAFAQGGPCYDQRGFLETLREQIPNVIVTFTDDQRLAMYGEGLMDYLNDEALLTMIPTYETLYKNWIEDTVQINSMTYPEGQVYNIMDTVNPQVDGMIVRYDLIHPVVPVNMPFFAVPKDRLENVTLPLTFDYSALELDKLNKGAWYSSVAKAIVNTALAVATGNFMAVICGGVDLMDDMRDLEKAAQDDPVGNANFKLNRASSTHHFYGLTDSVKTFRISGFADSAPKEYSAVDEGLAYAKLACDIAGAADFDIDSIVSLSGRVGDLIDGDQKELESTLTAFVSDPSLTDDEKTRIRAVFEGLRNGQLPSGQDLESALNALDIMAKATTGNDVFDSITALRDNLASIGGIGAFGHNLVKSQAYYNYGPYDDRKTEGTLSMAVVRSLPVQTLSVNLDKVHVYNNMEEPTYGITANAEVYLRTRVGVVTDGVPSYSSASLPFAQYVDADGNPVYNNGSNTKEDGYSAHPEIPFKAYTKRVFPTQEHFAPDREYTLPENTTLFEAAFESGSNTAAVYAEIGVFENDGKTIDDDMIGIWSGTFMLEDLFNSGKQYDWQRISDSQWRLFVTDYPVYDSRYLETTVEIGTNNTDKQIAHNRERLNHPSALISFHMDLELGSLQMHEDFETDLTPDPVSAVDMDQLNITAISSAAPANSSLAARIIGEAGGTLVTENKSSTNRIGRFFDVYDIAGGEGDTPPVITHRFRIPDDMTYDSVNISNVMEAFTKLNILSASLARGGDFLLILQRYEGGDLADSGRIFAIDLRGDVPVLTGIWRPARDYNPFRMAVDADGETVYISLRSTDIDIDITTLTDDGLFENTTENYGLPFTVVSMTPLSEGELLIRSCDGVANGSENWGNGFFTTDDFNTSKKRTQALMLVRTNTSTNTLSITDYLTLEDYPQFLTDYSFAKPDDTGPVKYSDSRVLFAYGPNLDTAVNIERSDGSLRLSDIRDSNEMALEDGRWATTLIGKLFPEAEFPLTASERVPYMFKKDLDILNWPSSFFNMYQAGDIRYCESTGSIGEFIYYSVNPRYMIALSGSSYNMLKPVDCKSSIADCSLAVIDMFYDDSGSGGGGGGNPQDPTAIYEINTLKGEDASCNGCLPGGVIYARSDMIYVQVDTTNGIYMYDPANDYRFKEKYLGEYSYMAQATDMSIYGSDFIIGYGRYVDDGSGNTITEGGVDLILEQEDRYLNLGTWNWIMDIVQKPEIAFLAEKDHGVGVYDKNTGGVPPLAFYDDPDVLAIDYGPTSVTNSLTVLSKTFNLSGDPQGAVKVIVYDAANGAFTETRSLSFNARIPSCLETYANYAYVGTTEGGGTLDVVNLSPASPVFLTSLTFNEPPSKLIIASNGNLMYALCGSYIQEISIANAASPVFTRIWEPEQDHMLMDMALSPDGNKLYVSDFASKTGPAVVRVLNLVPPS